MMRPVRWGVWRFWRLIKRAAIIVRRRALVVESLAKRARDVATDREYDAFDRWKGIGKER